MSRKPRICAIVEARMTSTRLPGKVLLPAAGKPMLELMVERLRRAALLDGIIIATTAKRSDDPIAALAHHLGVGCHRGSEADVMRRVLEAAEIHGVEVIAEITADCPLIDPGVIDAAIRHYLDSGLDYVTTALEDDTYPVGIGLQVFSTAVLADAARRTADQADHEHVTLFLYRHPELYRLGNCPAPPHLTDPTLRLTLDTAEDYEVIRRVFEALYPAKPDFTLADILAFMAANPALRAVNSQIEQRLA